MASEAEDSEGSNRRNSPCKFTWKSSKEGDKWNKKPILVFRNERLDMQKEQTVEAAEEALVDCFSDCLDFQKIQIKIQKLQFYFAF